MPACGALRALDDGDRSWRLIDTIRLRVCVYRTLAVHNNDLLLVSRHGPFSIRVIM